MAVRSKRWLFALCAPAIAAARAAAQESIGFSHESYVEDHDRMQVQTESLRIQKTLTPWLDLRISEVFDAISGATPVGAPAINQLTLHDPRTQRPNSIGTDYRIYQAPGWGIGRFTGNTRDRAKSGFACQQHRQSRRNRCFRRHHLGTKPFFSGVQLQQ